MAVSNPLPPPVQWAQRKNLVYLNIALEDTKDPTIKIEDDKFYFRGAGGTDRKEHEVTIQLYGKVKPDESKFIVRQRNIEVVLIKEEEQYWPRLLSAKTKFHWLKVDFNKWKDEEESEEETVASSSNNFDFEDLMSKMGSQGGMTGSNFNVGDEPEEDSDEEGLPDLE